MSQTPEWSWRPAELGDREPLSVFVCTDPEKPHKSAVDNYRTSHHPRLWEYDVQCMLRGLAAKIPMGPDHHVIVGYDDEGLVGAAYFVELPTPGQFHLELLGIAQRVRWVSKGEAARSLFGHMLREIEKIARAEGAEVMEVQGEIYRDNAASMRLCGDFELTSIGEEYSTGAVTFGLIYPLT